jgi:nitrogen fixation protein FixH
VVKDIGYAGGMKPLLALLLSLPVWAADWQISYRVPKAAKANFETTMEIEIKDAKGQPLAGASVESVLTMVEMDHGEHKHPAREVKPGIYQARVNFFMVGAWQIEVRAKKGKDTAARKFRYEIAD